MLTSVIMTDAIMEKDWLLNLSFEYFIPKIAPKQQPITNRVTK